jgi:hypothetical protein
MADICAKDRGVFFEPFVGGGKVDYVDIRGRLAVSSRAVPHIVPSRGEWRSVCRAKRRGRVSLALRHESLVMLNYRGTARQEWRIHEMRDLVLKVNGWKSGETER